MPQPTRPRARALLPLLGLTLVVTIGFTIGGAAPAGAQTPVWVEITSPPWATITAGTQQGTDVFFDAAPGQPIRFRVDPGQHWDGSTCWVLGTWTIDIDLLGQQPIPNSTGEQEIGLNVPNAKTVDIAPDYDPSDQWWLHPGCWHVP